MAVGARVVAQPAPRRPSGRRPGERAWAAYLYILPGLAVYAFFILWPIVQTAIYSFFDWDGLTPPQPVGFANYAELAGDPLFHTALANNLVFIFYYSLLPIALGLLLTALLTRRRLAGMALFRTGLFLPQVMALVVVGVVWRWIYNPVFGPLNELLRAVGLDAWARPWLGDFGTALPAVGFIAAWVQYGFCMVLFLAGAQRIDETLYDAAKIDGAGEARQFRHITLPGLRAEISVALITTLIAALRVFDVVFVTTRGGPANRTLVAALYLYRNGFINNRVGYAAAIAMVLTALILLLSIAVLVARRRPASER